MSSRPPDRSQAIQIGAVLIFGILIIFLTLYQGFVVPNQNEEIEFDHNQQLQSEMTDMRSSIISMPGRSTTESVSLTLGVRYPSRALFVNPGPASGTVRTVGTRDQALNLTIENATADGEVGDFWNGTARSYNTGGIEYRPGYNLFATAPRTIYEHSVLFNGFGENTTLPLTEQAMVNDNRITLVTLNGSLSESRVGDAAIDFEPLSTETKTVEVYNETSNVTISVPTRMTESEWKNVFEEELSQGNVTAVNTTPLPTRDGFSLLEITLEPGSYMLQLAKIGVGTGTTQPEEAYLTDTSGNNNAIQMGETRTLEFEVRDAFNNPLSGVTVKGSAENGSFTSSDTETVRVETDGNGQLTVEYEGRNPGDNAINLTIDEGYTPAVEGQHTAGTPRNVTTTVTVNAPPETGGGSGSAFNVSWLDPSGEPGTGTNCDEKSCTLNYTAAQQLTLTVGSPTTNAQVNFAVSDTNIATLDNNAQSTDKNGEASITLQPQANGTVSVYAWSGGSGDTITITIENYESSLAFSGQAVFVKKGGSGKIQLADNAGVTELGGDGGIIGPLTSTFDSDSLDKIPYVNSDAGEIRLIDENGNTELLMDGVEPRTQKSLLAVGDWDGNPTSVYFAGGSGEKLYRQDENLASDNSELVLDNSDGAGVRAVLGVADITGDGSKELVFKNTENKKLSYLKTANGSPTEITITGRQIGENNAPGIGRPADFDNDGEARIPVVDDNNNLLLVASDGTPTEIVSGVTKAPVAPIDWDDDGDLEIVFIDGNELKYVDDPAGSANVVTININEKASDSSGVT